MIIIMRCFSDDEGCGIDYAVLHVTPDLIASLAKRLELARELRRKDSDIYELSFWSNDCVCFDYADLYEKLEEKLGDGSGCIPELDDDNWTAIADDRFDFRGIKQQAIELQLLQVSPPLGNNFGYIEWYFRPKHCDSTATTTALTLEDIREALSMEGIIA